MRTISTDTLHRELDAGPVALFDVRGDLDFEEGHIPGAMSAPPGSLNFRVVGVMNPGSRVIVYDGGRGGGLADEVVERLENLRMTNVVVYNEGIKGWRAAGLPVVPSAGIREFTHGPVTESRVILVDREQAYGGAFKNPPTDGEGAGG